METTKQKQFVNKLNVEKKTIGVFLTVDEIANLDKASKFTKKTRSSLIKMLIDNFMETTINKQEKSQLSN